MEKISVRRLFNYINDEELDFLSVKYNVDWNVKKLEGKELFKLLVFGVLTENRASSRVFESFYENAFFQQISNIEQEKKVAHSSIADRIGKIDVSFFQHLFENCVEKYGSLLGEKETEQLSIYDSTITSISSKLIGFGMKNGQKNKNGEQGKLSVKFTLGFKDLPFKVKFFKKQSEINEDLALGSILKEHVSSNKDIAVFDRGMKDRGVMKSLSANGQYFVTRIYNGSKYTLAKGSEEVKLDYQTPTLRLTSARKVHLYHSGRKVKETFRLIEGVLKDSEEKILFLSNLPYEDFDELQIAEIYRNRWQIEQFFRFIKQELNFKHFFSRNWNGIQVMTYVILIASIMLLTYIKLNDKKGYKIPKISFYNQLQNEIIENIVIYCGGDPTKIKDFKPK